MIAGDCIHRDVLYIPRDNFGGQGENLVFGTVFDCQRKCAEIDGCSYFSYWDDGTCHLSNSGAIKEKCSIGGHCGKVSGGPGVCPGKHICTSNQFR